MTPRVDEGACADCGAIAAMRLAALCYSCCRRRWRRMSDEQKARADEGDVEVWREEPGSSPAAPPATGPVQEPLLSHPEEP